MPQAAAHILILLFVLSTIRDYIKKRKGKTFSLHYVLIGGVAGIIPDLDIAAFWILNFFGFSINEIHRTLMHSLFIPIIFLFIGLIVKLLCEIKFGKNKIKLSNILFLFAIGSIFHLMLDGLFAGYIMPFYPLSNLSFGLNLFGYLPQALEKIAAPSLDAGLIITWLIYMEVKHKISDFI